MPDPRLEVHDSLGRRIVPLDKPAFTIGRRTGNDLHLMGSDVSRDHAEIAQTDSGFLVRDRGSRYGTFVNGTQINEHVLSHGDRIQLGRTGGAELVFLLDDAAPYQPHSTAVGDLRQVAVLLEGLRALGSGRVLDEVLALVMDSAIEVTGAERGFIMLANEQGELEMKLARARGRVTLPGTRFETSRKIPEEVFATGEDRIVADLLDGDLANVHMGTVALGIRHVLCTPLRLVRYVDERAAASVEQKRIGVLYLDSREKGTLLSRATRTALETLATEAAVAIENARLYRDSMEKARIEQELRIASQIQQALLPQPRRGAGFFSAMGTSIPCRAIGGDFFDYIDLADGRFGFVLGDVAGKGPPAALLTAVLQGIFAAQTFAVAEPYITLERINVALIHRSIESRFATAFFGVLAPDGALTYSNAGHNPPLLVTTSGIRRLEAGGLILGMFPNAVYDQETVQLEPGDLLVVFSDGVSEALSATGEEFGEQRIKDLVAKDRSASAETTLNRLLAAVHDFTRGAVQSDDVTALVVRYGG